MNLLTVVLMLVASVASHAADETGVTRLSEPVEQTADSESFGALVDDSVPLVSLEEVATNGAAYAEAPIRVITRVAKVCQKKGCFFIAREGTNVVRVSFKDYGFFVPTNIGGKQVTLVGEVVRRELSEDDAMHFAADLGSAEPSIKPGTVYEIVATSVRVPRS